MDGCLSPPCVGEEPVSHGLAPLFSSGLSYTGNLALPNWEVGCEAATFLSLLRACTKRKDVIRGARLHDDISKRGLLAGCSDALVTMYAACGQLGKAKALIDRHNSRDVITWTALIAGYVREGQGQNAMQCYECMHRNGILPNAVTYACILKACGILGAADRGKEVHDEIVRQGLLQNDVVLGNALMDMYAKCGALSRAHHAFKELPSQNVVSWTSLIAGYAQQGYAEQALECFEHMQHDGIPPNAVTFVCVLKACAKIGSAVRGEEIHDMILRLGLLPNNLILSNALVDMYAKCGTLWKAAQVLEELPTRDVISWNALIAGYAERGQGQQALNCFDRMKGDEILPDAVSYTCILKACGIERDFDTGKEIHIEITKRSLLHGDFVLGTALMDMYAKCGNVIEAQFIFDRLPSRNVVSWSALIAGYVQEDQSEQALNCFEQMHGNGVIPNAVTYACVLKVCATIGACDKGKKIHEEIAGKGYLQKDMILGNALVDMYVKCGALSEAERVLMEDLPSRDAVSWNALIAGHTQKGQHERAWRCLKHMQDDGILPDEVTFVCLLSMCSHLGLIEEGYAVFLGMGARYNVRPDLECYTCMVDLLARAGQVPKAVQLIQEMPSSDDAASLTALLGACQKWGHIHFGGWAFEQGLGVQERGSDLCPVGEYLWGRN